ncbi:MAG TPA: PQQ-binding-like beta-propeller repeat protein [Vicinamibacterales bacterium]|nr:PQQ-binding-like beta-propeller repeat protein [Vicinamibacterales bacterium]
MRVFARVFGLVLAVSGAAAAQDGSAVFQANCATCHAAAAQQARSPSIDTLRRQTPEAILNALLNGKMRIQAAALSDAERRAVAEFLGGRALAAAAAGSSVTACSATSPFRGPSGTGEWNGWGNGPSNTRFAKDGGLNAKDLPKLKLKWAFGFAGVTSARAQPALVGNRLFVASDTGDVHALDPKTGCAYWSVRAQATVRTALLVAPYSSASGNGWAVLFGDLRANAYALDASTGKVIWVRKVDDHPFAAITGSLTYYAGRVFVPVQGLNEEVQGGRPEYECCTFRGSVSALDVGTGALVWKTYTVAEKQPRGTNARGKRLWGPAGGGIWSAPTIDPRRGAVYVSTGNGYADPPQPMTDAVLALDLQSGKVRWVRQLLANDSWTLGCRATNTDNPNCPPALGPDYDFAASPALATVDGRDLLVLPQKSGMTYALDPDKQGTLVWQHRIGQGSGRGGQWGGAVDDRHAYFGVGDATTNAPGGMVAVRLATGERVWHAPPEKTLCGAPGRDCNAAQGAAVTAIPGAVLSGSYDGGLRAYAADDGSLLWQFDTNREFVTVNGVTANGGSMDGPGPSVAGGLLFVNSGYGGIAGRPGNVLLVFGVE